MKIVSRADLVDPAPEVQLVEVLPETEYGWAHLPGARSIPLRQLHERAAKEVDPARPVVVYCHDLYCDLGPRAAAWLAHNGFDDVAEFHAGKMDWLAAGYDYEGSADLVTRHLEPVPTCRPTDPVAAVCDVLDASPVAVAVDDDGVIVGALPEKVLAPRGAALAWEVADYAPTTVRPSEECPKLDARLHQHRRDYILVATNDGVLLGLYRAA